MPFLRAGLTIWYFRIGDNTDTTLPHKPNCWAMLLCMNRIIFAIALLLTCATMLGEPKGSRRTIPCKTPEIAPSCYWTRGRLRIANGNPSYRLWKIGTNRLLGIYSGPVAFNSRRESKYALDNEGPQFPSNVDRALWQSVTGPWPNVIFADFEVCPLDKEKPEVMQPACIESAKNLVVKKDE